MAHASRLARGAAALALFASACALYLPRAAVSVQESDGGEFAAAAVLGSIVHPPGYPLYMLFARILVRLFPENPYHTLALFSGVLQAAAVVMLFLCALRLIGRLAPAFALGAAWMVYEPTIRSAADAEVFALHHLLSMGIALSSLWLLSAEKDFGRRCFVTGLLCGLGGANHHAVVLWAPRTGAAFLSGFRTKGRRGGAGCAAAGLAGILSGLSPYLSLPLAADDRFSLGFSRPRTAGELLDYILRREYGTFSMHARTRADEVPQLLPFLGRSAAAIPLILAGFAAAIFAALSRRRLPAAALALAGLFHLYFATQLLIPARFAEFSMRFYGLLALAGCLALAAALAEIRIGPRLSALLSAALLLPAAIALPRALAGSDNAADRTTDYELESILRESPPGSLFISSLDRIGMGLRYKQAIGRGTQLLVVPATLLGSASGRRALQARYSIALQDTRDFAEWAARNGRRIAAYYETPVPAGFARWPIGITWQWLPLPFRPADREISERLLAFCARWPDGLGALSRYRPHSWEIVKWIFVAPGMLHLRAAGDREGAARYAEAAEAVARGDAAAARQICSGALNAMTGSPDASPRPYTPDSGREAAGR